MTGNKQFLGIVQNGTFQLLVPYRAPGDSVRLTRIQMQKNRPPESKELNLTEYEGKAIMVRGYDGGECIYSANDTMVIIITLSISVPKIVFAYDFIRNLFKPAQGFSGTQYGISAADLFCIQESFPQ